MYKKIVITLTLVFLTVAVMACSSQYNGEVSEIETNAKDKMSIELERSSGSVAHSDMPLTFESEAEFNAAINEARERGGEDIYSLAGITKYFRPKTLMRGFALFEIVVKDVYVSYSYRDENNNFASFTWDRLMNPVTALEGLRPGREFLYNGIRYVFLEYANEDTGELEVGSVFWVDDGKVFSASFSSSYSDEEILAFCDYETVPVGNSLSIPVF